MNNFKQFLSDPVFVVTLVFSVGLLVLHFWALIVDEQEPEVRPFKPYKPDNVSRPVGVKPPPRGFKL